MTNLTANDWLLVFTLAAAAVVFATRKILPWRIIFAPVLAWFLFCGVLGLGFVAFWSLYLANGGSR